MAKMQSGCLLEKHPQFMRSRPELPPSSLTVTTAVSWSVIFQLAQQGGRPFRHDCNRRGPSADAAGKDLSIKECSIEKQRFSRSPDGAVNTVKQGRQPDAKK